MLAAISTTILSNRSWALTCSAMVSRSRLNRTRGPPDALRICSYPHPLGQPSLWPDAGAKRTKSNKFVHPVPSSPLSTAESGAPKPWVSLPQPVLRPYSESTPVLPSKRPAKLNHVECCRREAYNPLMPCGLVPRSSKIYGSAHDRQVRRPIAQILIQLHGK